MHTTEFYLPNIPDMRPIHKVCILLSDEQTCLILAFQFVPKLSLRELAVFGKKGKL